MAFLKPSLVFSSVVVAGGFMALLFFPGCGQQKAVKKDATPSVQIAPPGGYNPKEDKTPWRAAQTPDFVRSTDSAESVLPDRQPFPPKGFAKGVIEAIGDDSGQAGTYRLVFRWQVNGQGFPLIECRLLQALEDKLSAFGRQAHQGKLTVEVKGTVTQYRGANFLLLNDFRLPEGPFKEGGTPAAAGGLQNLP